LAVPLLPKPEIAAEMQKPDGLSIIKAEDIPTKLFNLSLRDIPGIGHKILKKLHSANIDTIEKLYSCSSGQLQTIWGSVYGKKCWYLLRGFELSEYAVKNRVIGHSRILAPGMRSVRTARDIAVELMMKASKRIREKELYSTSIGLYLRTTNKLVYKSYAKISASNDNSTILKQLLIVWERLIAQYKVDSFHQVAISLSGLTEKPRQLTFDDLGTINKNRDLSVAIDNINNKYAQTIISFGMPPAIKDEPIAFGHIPGANVKEYLN